MIHSNRACMCSMGTVNKNGPMMPDTKAIGEMDKLKVKENFIIQTEIFMQETSIKIDQMVMENIFIVTVNNILVCGKMTCKKVKVQKSCLMDQSTKGCSNKDKNGEKVSTSGLMDLVMMVSGQKIILKEQENTNGQTANYIQVNGKKIKCTEKESTLGLMEENMKVNILMT